MRIVLFALFMCSGIMAEPFSHVVKGAKTGPGSPTLPIYTEKGILNAYASTMTALAKAKTDGNAPEVSRLIQRMILLNDNSLLSDPLVRVETLSAKDRVLHSILTEMGRKLITMKGEQLAGRPIDDLLKEMNSLTAQVIRLTPLSCQ